MKKHVITSLLLLLTVIFGMQAQTPIPFDPALRIGKLDNGLTYFIRKSTLPEGQACFYLAQKVGSMQEDDSQKGLAHFLEHMAFGGTKNFPDKILDAVERSGGKLGPNLNAYTSYDQTVYYLSNIPVKTTGIVDTCLLILHDWCGFINLKEDAIDRERKVIKEEWRQRQGAGARISKQEMLNIFPGSKYADRSPIGDMEIVENFKYDELRNYYHKWYRPDLQGLIIVGDIDVDQVEAKIKTMFADLPKQSNPAERVYYPVPDNADPIVSVVTDPEATSTSLSVMIKHDCAPVDQRRTREFLLGRYIRYMTAGMLTSRLSDIAQKSDAPFASAQSYYSNFSVANTKEAMGFWSRPKEGMIVQTLETLLTEKERIIRYGFTDSEIERAKTNYLKNYENQYINRDKKGSAHHVNDILHNFLITGPITGVEYEYNLMKEVFPTWGKAEFDAMAKELFNDEENLVVSIMGIEKDGLVYPTREEILAQFATVKKKNIEPYKDTTPEGELIDKLPAAGKIVKESRNEKYDVTEWTLSNGMKVVFKVTDFQADNISMSGVGYGGVSLFNDDEIMNASYASAVTNIGGVGKFSLQEMQKILTGKKAGVSSSISGETQRIGGHSSKADMEIMFQLMYLHFTSPRKDMDAFATYKERMKQGLRNKYSSPDAYYGDSINKAIFGDNPRILNMTEADVDKLDYDRMIEMHKTCFANPGSFVINFSGTIDEATFRPLVEKYLASLPSGNKNIKPVDRKYDYRKGKYENHFVRKSGENKASVYIMYNGVMPRIDTLAFRLHILNGVLNTTLKDAMRGDAGGVYGVGSNYSIDRIPDGRTALRVSFSTDPDRTLEMKGIVHRVLKDVAENGVSDEIFKKEVENQLKNYDSYQRADGFWNAIMEILYFYNEDENGSFDYRGQIQSVTKDEIQKMVKDLISQGNVLEVVMITEKE